MKKERHYELLYIMPYWDSGVWNKQNSSTTVQESFQTGFDLMKLYLDIKCHKLSEGYFIWRGL